MRVTRIAISGGLLALVLALGAIAGVLATGNGDRLLGVEAGHGRAGTQAQVPLTSLASVVPVSTTIQSPRIQDRPPALLSSGDAGPRVRDLQARLKQIDWLSGDVTSTYDARTAGAVRGFQAKRGLPVTGVVDRRTWSRLTSMTSKPSHAALFNLEPQPGALDDRCRHGRVLCIDKATRSLRWVIDGTVRMRLDVRFGASYTPTREGVFSVYLKSADHVSRLYGSSMPFAMFFSGGQAVHYSSDFAAVGYAGASHGCVNVRDRAGIEALFAQVHVGDRVVVYWS